MGSTLGMYIGVKSKEPLAVMRLGDILLVAATVFPPVYYPVALPLEGARMLAFLLPTVAAPHLIADGPAMYASVATASLLAWLAVCVLIPTSIEFVEE